jgi:hypothetical protein
VLKVSAGFQSCPLQKNLQGKKIHIRSSIPVLTGSAAIKPSDGTIELLQVEILLYPDFCEIVSEKQKVAP